MFPELPSISLVTGPKFDIAEKQFHLVIVRRQDQCPGDNLARQIGAVGGVKAHDEVMQIAAVIGLQQNCPDRGGKGSFRLAAIDIGCTAADPCLRVAGRQDGCEFCPGNIAAGNVAVSLSVEQ